MKAKIVRLIDALSEKFILNQHFRLAQNIKLELVKRANQSTVDYVEKAMRNVTSVDSKWKVHEEAIKHVSLEGLYLEFGVFKGNTINYVSERIDSVIYGFDSFEGLPEFWRDGFDKGTFAIDGLPKVRKNVKLVKGLFDQTLPQFLQDHPTVPVAYLHIDCDLYSSTKTVFELLKDRIKKGTVIVFDEYFNFPGWEQDEFRAFHEFLSETGLKYEYITYNFLHEQVAVKIV
ncbi:class I SAM-dependent methyltransferase [Belliella pelovolcani]|uniref:class I SAM-dependent methyltransferase n=1 Tax=Belliella pelovolcani TaxID=529505 RepID=UPI00391A4CC9